MTTQINIKIGKQTIEFEITVKDVFGGNNCKWFVNEKNESGIVYSGYVSDGMFGEWTACRSITYFREWLKGKVMTAIKKEIKLK